MMFAPCRCIACRDPYGILAKRRAKRRRVLLIAALAVAMIACGFVL